jgi:multidrug resistance efflux pump
MQRLLTILNVALIAGGFLFGLSLLRADPSKAEKPATDENLQVRYARAHLELAKLDLRRVTELNKRVPHAVSAGTIDECQRHVEIDEEQLKQYLKGDKADIHGIFVRRAEIEVELAEANVQRQREVHVEFGTASSELELERSQLVAQLAKLHLERARSFDVAKSMLFDMQWQIEELRNEVAELRARQ